MSVLIFCTNGLFKNNLLPINMRIIDLAGSFVFHMNECDTLLNDLLWFLFTQNSGLKKRNLWFISTFFENSIITAKFLILYKYK